MVGSKTGASSAESGCAQWITLTVACAWGAALLWLNPRYFFWIAPVIGAIVLSVPISVLVSRVRIGDVARRLGLFCIPEESNPALELREVEADLQERASEEAAEAAAGEPSDGFVRCAVEPHVNALHRALLGHRHARLLRRDVDENFLRDGHGGSARPWIR